MRLSTHYLSAIYKKNKLLKKSKKEKQLSNYSAKSININQ